jgi:ABC-type proline/glycine betaine transport system permease subunit
MSQPGEDAQRDMERRALRNVRGLVDKIENDDALSRRAQMRTLIGMVLAAVVIAVVLGIVLSRRDAARSVVIETPKPGQLVPQGPRAPQ